MPNLIAYDVCGVQPMTGPTGLIFALKSRYNSQTGGEALFYEANAEFSAASLGGTQVGTGDPTGNSSALANATNFTAAHGMDTLAGEALGANNNANLAIPQMAFSIDKVTVTAKTRKLKARVHH